MEFSTFATVAFLIFAFLGIILVYLLRKRQTKAYGVQGWGDVKKINKQLRKTPIGKKLAIINWGVVVFWFLLINAFHVREGYAIAIVAVIFLVTFLSLKERLKLQREKIKEELIEKGEVKPQQQIAS